MRVKSMEKELPEEVVQVLNKMFKQVTDKDVLEFDANAFDGDEDIDK